MISKLNAKQFLEMTVAGKDNLKRHIDEVNALNKFPIPDYDTGTNMVCTMEFALDDLQYLENGLRDLALRIFIRMGTGAEGKSGEVLARFFDGFVEPLGNRQLSNCQFLKYSFQNAQVKLIFLHQAYANCIPNIMQIMEKMVDAAERLSSKNDLERMMYRMIADAKECIKENEITDAGCIGLLYVIEGMYLSFCGKINYLR